MSMSNEGSRWSRALPQPLASASRATSWSAVVAVDRGALGAEGSGEGVTHETQSVDKYP